MKKIDVWFNYTLHIIVVKLQQHNNSQINYNAKCQCHQFN